MILPDARTLSGVTRPVSVEERAGARVPGHFGKTRDSAELHSSLALGNGVIRHCPWFLRFLIGFFQHRHPGLRCPPPLPPFAVQKRRCFQPGVRSRTRPRVLRRPFNPGKPVGKPVSLNCAIFPALTRKTGQFELGKRGRDVSFSSGFPAGRAALFLVTPKSNLSSLQFQ